MGDGRLYDGHTTMFGVDTDADPSELDARISAKAINRQFRGGKNLTRPPFIHRPFVFDQPEDEPIVRFGNFQGACSYRKNRPGREDGIAASIAGHLFFFSLVNQKWLVRRIIESTNNAKLMHTWFIQANDWLYIQNGLDKPIFWDGLFPSTARRSNWPDEKEMPVGTIGVYAHGRVFLSDAYGQVKASDIIYGDNFTKTSNTQKFTEEIYWNEGGSFGTPIEIGEITGMAVVARQDKDLRGQGEVLVLSQDGAASIEASLARPFWKDAQIQSVSLTGRGCDAYGTVIGVNNDIWFRSSDGLASYSIYRSDEKTKFSFGKISREVNIWFDNDTADLIQFESAIYSNNRILTTVNPQLDNAVNEDHGNHRFMRGIVAVDLDAISSKRGGGQINWDGLWTGIRPTVLLSVRLSKAKRAFAFSFDTDGENRIYEIAYNEVLNDEINGTGKQTEWFYLTKRFDWLSSGKSNAFETKKFIGGEMWISGVRDRIEVSADYRTDNCPCWTPALKPYDFGSKLEGFTFSAPRWKKITFDTPQDKCIPGVKTPSAHGSQHQLMVSGKGSVKIDRLRIAMDGNVPQEVVGNTCKPDDPKTAIDCAIESDYSFSIVDAPAIPS